jgi:HEPN domain-containing protein
MNTIAQHERSYVEWQNRSTRFYLAARHLYNAELFAPAAYCAAMSIELMLKATLIYWDRKFKPEAASHGMAKLARMVGNRVNAAKGFKVPEYFYFEKRFLSVSRYPTNGKGVVVPSTLLGDLDSLITFLVPLVPFQHNTELKRVLRGRDRSALNILRRKNSSIRSLRRALGNQ